MLESYARLENDRIMDPLGAALDRGADPVVKRTHNWVGKVCDEEQRPLVEQIARSRRHSQCPGQVPLARRQKQFFRLSNISNQLDERWTTSFDGVGRLDRGGVNGDERPDADSTEGVVQREV